jgi:hypothetical protein
VGTKRYMSPEVLDQSIDRCNNCFSQVFPLVFSQLVSHFSKLLNKKVGEMFEKQ